jgi:hypothetical protein
MAERLDRLAAAELAALPTPRLDAHLRQRLLDRAPRARQPIAWLPLAAAAVLAIALVPLALDAPQPISLAMPARPEAPADPPAPLAAWDIAVSRGAQLRVGLMTTQATAGAGLVVESLDANGLVIASTPAGDDAPAAILAPGTRIEVDLGAGLRVHAVRLRRGDTVGQVLTVP